METENGAGEDMSKVDFWGNALLKCGYLLMDTSEDCWAELGHHAEMEAERRSHAVHTLELVAAAATHAPMSRGGASTAWHEASLADLPPSPPPGRHLDAGSSTASMLGREEEERKRNEGQFGHSA
uniref:Uncharacterized protein n=1 Tax=Oryza meridionalis TaxID=40149 RepID=A0A0E0EKK7_9ORYZ